MQNKFKSRRNHSDKDRAQEIRIKQFTSEINDIIIEFLHADELRRELKPMNSFFRRITHLEAQKYNIITESVGEDDERYSILVKNENTKKPEDVPLTSWDFRDKEFVLADNLLSKEVSLLKTGEVRLSNTKNTIEDRLEVDRKIVNNNRFTIRNGKIIEA